MRHISEIAACLVRTFPKDLNFPARWIGQSRESAQQRSLPSSVVTENCVESSRIKLRRHAAQGSETPKLLDDIADCNDRGGGVGHRLERNFRGFTPALSL